MLTWRDSSTIRDKLRNHHPINKPATTRHLAAADWETRVDEGEF